MESLSRGLFHDLIQNRSHLQFCFPFGDVHPKTTCQIWNSWTRTTIRGGQWQRRPQLLCRCSARTCKAYVQYRILTRVIMPRTPGRNTSNANRRTTPPPTKSVKRKQQEGLQELFTILTVVLSFENCMLSSGHGRQGANLLRGCARTIKAGDNIEVLKQRLPDGWSLVRVAGQVGLVPESYYTVSGDRVPSPSYLSGILLRA
jgi:Variant SH3 domain